MNGQPTPVAASLRELAARHALDVDAGARFPQELVSALREQRLLAAYVPVTRGGLGWSLRAIAELCETLGRGCASGAMVFAMHQIQVACIVHHGGGSGRWERLLEHIAQKQPLIASITSEAGVGGDIRTSRCAVKEGAGGLEVDKQATTLSYGAHADGYLLTARRTADSPGSDQVLVWLERERCRLTAEGVWNPLGMRGTYPANSWPMTCYRRSSPASAPRPWRPSRTSYGVRYGSASQRTRFRGRKSSCASGRVRVAAPRRRPKAAWPRPRRSSSWAADICRIPCGIMKSCAALKGALPVRSRRSRSRCASTASRPA